MRILHETSIVFVDRDTDGLEHVQKALGAANTLGIRTISYGNHPTKNYWMIIFEKLELYSKWQDLMGM